MGRTGLLILGIFLLYKIINVVSGNINNILVDRDHEIKRATFIKDIVVSIPNRKGWMNFLAVGNWSDVFFGKIQGIERSFLVANDEYEYYEVEEHLQYRVNTLVLKCLDFQDFEKKLDIVRNIPFWHPHTNTIVYYQKVEEDEEIIAKMFFILWFYKICNAIILQYNDNSENFLISHYNPYISEHYKLKQSYGCWTLKKITFPIENFDKGFVCTDGCHNVTVRSKLRANHLGTCIGFETIYVRYNDNASYLGFTLFNDKTKNLHKFTLRTYIKEVLPFVQIQVNGDGNYTISERDGFIWTALSQTMNFTMDFSPSESIMKHHFIFEESIQQIYEFSHRKGDLLIIPVYQFDLVIVQIDMTMPFKASGVCFISRRAGFETILFDVKLLQKNYSIVVEFTICFLGTWFVFFVFNVVEKGTTGYDQVGKDLINAFRNILSVSLFKPPKKQSFRIFLAISMWSFFVLNFATQAAIISFFSAYKRGKDVETYDDIIEKGYPIEGLASPDVILPNTDEKFRKINSKLVSNPNIYGCVDRIINDSRRFCLIDCAVGRYLERNKLNAKGEQYLHVAKDMIHSHYLNFILHKDSPMTDQYNRIMLIFLQAGLINKWEEYRFADLKYEVPIKALNVDDLEGVFKCFIFLTCVSVLSFLIEVAIGTVKYTKQRFITWLFNWRRTRAIRKYLKLERKQNNIKITNSSTQTI